jgi:hypothetical protein
MKRMSRTAVLGVLLVASLVQLSARQAQPAAPGFAALGRAAIEELAAGAFDKFIARIDPAAGAALTRDKLKALWTSITTQAGAFQKITAVRVEDAKDGPTAVVTCAFEKQSLAFRVTFNNRAKIVGFFLAPADDPVNVP